MGTDTMLTPQETRAPAWRIHRWARKERGPDTTWWPSSVSRSWEGGPTSQPRWGAQPGWPHGTQSERNPMAAHVL